MYDDQGEDSYEDVTSAIVCEKCKESDPTIARFALSNGVTAFLCDACQRGFATLLLDWKPSAEIVRLGADVIAIEILLGSAAENMNRVTLRREYVENSVKLNELQVSLDRLALGWLCGQIERTDNI